MVYNNAGKMMSAVHGYEDIYRDQLKGKVRRVTSTPCGAPIVDR